MSQHAGSAPGLAIGIDIGGTKIAAGLGDCTGRLIVAERTDTRAEDGAERVLGRALDLARSLQDRGSGTGQSLVGVGLSTMGITLKKSVKLAPAVPGWDSLAIPEVLATAFPSLPTAIWNDVKAATLAELIWGGLAGVSNGVYINLGTGLAAGVVIGGAVVDGHHAAAGEVGYFVEAPGDLDGLTRETPEPVPLAEERYGGRGIASQTAVRLGSPCTVAELVVRSRREPEVAAFLEEKWTGTGVLLANIATLLDPEVVVVGGGFMRSPSWILERLEGVVQLITPFPPVLRLAHFSTDAALHGAIALGLSAASGSDVSSREGTK